MTISLLPKLAGEVRRYGHDWTAFLGDDTIASQSNTITGATLDSATIDTGSQSVVFTISGGTAGTAARLTHTITTAAGDHETEVFRIPIGAEEPVTLREAKAQTNMVYDDSEEYLIGKRAMLLLIGHWFENREAFVLGTVSPDVDFAICQLLDELRPVSAY
jgi:hypothetical protein